MSASTSYQDPKNEPSVVEKDGLLEPASSSDPVIALQVVAVDEEEVSVAVPTVEDKGYIRQPNTTTESQQQQQQQQHPFSSTTPVNRQHDRNKCIDDDSDFDCLLCGDAKITHLKRGNNWSISLCGDTYIDLRRNDALSTDNDGGSGGNGGNGGGSPRKVNVTLMRLCGDAKILVPRGTKVKVQRILLCGSRDVQVEESPRDQQEGDPIVLTVRIMVLCGDLRVRSE